MLVNGKAYRTVWMERGAVRMIDQRLLPHEFRVVSLPTYRETARAIKVMTVRGAGAIGAAAGYAIAQAALEAGEASFRSLVDEAAQTVRATRPTAHDLFFAVDGVREAALGAADRAGTILAGEEVPRTTGGAATVAQGKAAAVETANRLADDNAKAGEQIGLAGLSLLRSGMRLLTHCNAGWLAFVDWGSALAPIYQAQRRGIELFVYATETRPRSQGAKLTAWELQQAGIAHAVIADTAVGSHVQRGQIDAVIVGADRIAANGDVANKIGTYQIALLAKHHGIPFYVAAPRSTVDLATPDGSAIVIEERSEDEVAWVWGRTQEGTLTQVRLTPEGSPAKNPAFDVTPASLVRAFITEAGLLDPDPRSLAQFARGHLETSV